IDVLLRALFSTCFPYTTLFRSSSIKWSAASKELSLPTWDSIWGGFFMKKTGNRCRPLTLSFKRLNAWKVAIGTTHPLDFEERLRSEEHTSELQSRENLVCRLLL